MSAAACLVFFKEKAIQTDRVYREKYSLTVAMASIGPAEWASEHEPDLHAGYKASMEKAEELWRRGDFGDEFKKHILNHLRGFLEICRKYDVAIRQQEAA